MVKGRGATYGLTAALLALCVLGRPEAYSRLGPRMTALMGLVSDGTTLNDADAEAQVRGYYEELTHVERFDARLAQALGVAPDESWLRPGRFVRRETNDFREMELMPSLDVIAKGAPFHTNRFGMRDRDYPQRPAPGSCRMALVGQSPSAGGGVSDGEIFEARLEDRLNREHAELPFPSYEILNFAQPAYTLLDQLIWIDKSRLFDFAPAILLYVAHTNEVDRISDKLSEAIHDGVTIPFPEVAAQVASVGATPGLDAATLRIRLKPLGETLLRWAYQQIAAQCRAHHVRPVWIYLPLVPRRAGDEPPREVREPVFAAARDAGFQIVDLSDVWQHRDQKSLAQAPWDDHPNTFAHGLIAERLYRALRESDRTAPLGIFTPLTAAQAGEGGCVR